MRDTATRGDLRLFVTPIDNPSWEKVEKGFALDPVWLPTSRHIAFSTNTGPALVDITMRTTIRQKVGRFAWGAPSISVNAAGTRVGFVKWRGDARLIGTWNVETDQVQILRASCYRYSWWDDETIAFELGDGPKLVNVLDGRISRLAHREDLLDAARLVAPAQLALIRHGTPPVDVRQPIFWNTHAVSAWGDRLWFAVHVAQREARPPESGLFSVTRSMTDPVLHGWFAGWRLVNYAILAEGRLIWARFERGINPIEHRSVFFGSIDIDIDDAWHPLPRHPLPEFGSHFFGG
jgi:hypothetical protein